MNQLPSSGQALTTAFAPRSSDRGSRTRAWGGLAGPQTPLRRRAIPPRPAGRKSRGPIRASLVSPWPVRAFVLLPASFGRSDPVSYVPFAAFPQGDTHRNGTDSYPPVNEGTGTGVGEGGEKGIFIFERESSPSPPPPHASQTALTLIPVVLKERGGGFSVTWQVSRAGTRCPRGTQHAHGLRGIFPVAEPPRVPQPGGLCTDARCPTQINSFFLFSDSKKNTAF